MLIEIYSFLMILAIILLISGFLTDLPFLSLFGCIIIFGLGILMLNNQVEVKQGENITFSYDDANLTATQTVRYDYVPYAFGSVAGISYGWIVMFIGLITGIMVIIMAGD